MRTPKYIKNAVVNQRQHASAGIDVIEPTNAPGIADPTGIGVHAPRLSIGLPVYNGERYLGEAIDALLAQTYRDFELIISDNGSTDGTANIALAYAARDSRIRYVRNERNIGGSRNHERVFELARGELFRWAAADDLCAPETVARCVAALDRRPDAVLAYPNTYLIGEFGEVLEEYEDGLYLEAPRPSDRFVQLFEHMRRCVPMYGVIRSNVLRKTGGLRPFVGSDIVLLAELALRGTFVQIPERLFSRRMHGGATSAADFVGLKRYYNPGKEHRVFMMEWRHLWELWKVLVRVPLGVVEKARVARILLRRARYNRHELAREVWDAAATLLTPRQAATRKS
jgi:glycosyltransferase involved in cell wall biosynthesis